MKSFTILLTFTIAAIAAGSHALATPNSERNEVQISNAPEFPENECGMATEMDIPAGSLDQRSAIIGPPDHWCCDGFPGEYHSGNGRRVCCPIGLQCCNIIPDSVFAKPGWVKSTLGVGDRTTFATYFKSGKNCGGDSCMKCGDYPTIHGGFRGFSSVKRYNC